MSTGPQVTIFLEPAAPGAAAAAIERRIEAENAADISSAQVVPRDEALGRLRKNPAWSEALAVLPGNPLPDAVIVTLGGTDFAERAGRLATTWQGWEHVDHVQLDSQWVQRLQALLRFAQLGLLLLAIGVAVVVLATVFNT